MVEVPPVWRSGGALGDTDRYRFDPILSIRSGLIAMLSLAAGMVQEKAAEPSNQRPPPFVLALTFITGPGRHLPQTSSERPISDP
jgi:hypothetical protein